MILRLRSGFRQRARTPANHLNCNVWTTKKRIEKLRYMHRNPVKRGLVASPEQWRWSSYRFYLLGEVGPVRVNEGIEWQSVGARKSHNIGSIIPALAKNARTGHPQSWSHRQNQRPGHPSNDRNAGTTGCWFTLEPDISCATKTGHFNLLRT